MIAEVLRTIPWFWPVTAVATIVAGLTAGRVAASLRIGWMQAFWLLISIGGIVALTLTPAASPATRACQLIVPGLVTMDAFVPLTERGLNVLLFIPLGVALGLVPRSRIKAEAVLLAAVSPVTIELTQYVARGLLGRACEAGDVLDNLTGLGIGFVVAGVVGRLHARRPGRRGARASDARI